MACVLGEWGYHSAPLMMLRQKLPLSVLLAGVLIAACSSSSNRQQFETPAPEPTDKPGDTPPPLGNGQRAPTNEVTITGTVYAPNGSLPIPNALVYITKEEPAAIPEGAYCDECVGLPEDQFALSNSDGTFSWQTSLPTGDYFIVTQKGQFRRVRKLTVDKSGEIALKKDFTTLPGRTDASNGDTVPKMAVLKGSSYFDKIDESLAKLGIDEIDVLDDSRAILKKPAELAKYHIVFVPCGEKDNPQMKDSTIKTNIRNYVASGGRFYVTDWSYEYVRQPFPGYIQWENEGAELGSATIGMWDAPATASDQGLGDWLNATGDSKFDVEGNWTEIKQVRTVQGPDPSGNPIDITPRVWVSAKRPGATATHPTTVSFEYACGRVLFSTYHTESDFGSTLHAQEKALLYVLLEVGVCIGEQAKPK